VFSTYNLLKMFWT